MDDILKRHEFTEAVGGYIECSCGWPTHEQFNSNEHIARHVIAELELESVNTLAEIARLFRETFKPDFKGFDWRDDNAIQRFAFAVGSFLFRWKA